MVTTILISILILFYLLGVCLVPRFCRQIVLAYIINNANIESYDDLKAFNIVKAYNNYVSDLDEDSKLPSYAVFLSWFAIFILFSNNKSILVDYINLLNKLADNK